ncbi:hypothetical protein [Adhaeribacter radiodurans]|uniref:Uncharacterized protein n=1 Tax=Adhaeribacter radiodurans TaxID=2745197 RepID=A0A7L7L8B1_9BACT|nr:hypothetical protein [Adhaeribacter radiodurans]QMU29072.1 hypothetical protein HUW48_13930 [Adhaeribacter radiodurans]
MEAKVYSTLKEEEYQTLSQQLSVLAENLTNKQPILKEQNSNEFNQASREVLQFLKHLI